MAPEPILAVSANSPITTPANRRKWPGLLAGSTLTACAPETETIDVPDEYAAAFEQGAEGGALKFYALADHVPTWEALSQAGALVCSEHRPAVIPEDAQGSLGSFAPGTLVTLSTDSIKELLGIEKLFVTVPPAVKGCTQVALEEMRDDQGMLLMVDSIASFDEKSQLVEVALK